MPGPVPGLGEPDVAGRRCRRRRRPSRCGDGAAEAVGHGAGPYPGRRAPGGLRLPAAAGGHRPDARRAARRRPAARRPRAPAPRRPTATSATCPSCCAPATSSSSTRRACIPARLRVHRATGGAAEVLLLEPAADGTWEALVRPSAGCATARCWPTPTAPRWSEIGRRAGGADARRAPPRRPRPVSSGTERCRCRPTSRRALADPERYQTVYAGVPGSVAAPTAGLHLTPAVLAGLAERGIAVATVELVVGLDTFKPVDRRRSRRPPHAQRALPRAARDDGRVPRRRAGGGRRHHDGAGPRERGRHRRAERAHHAVHPPALPVAGGRRAAHQLPPAPHDAADDDRRLRRAALA